MENSEVTEAAPSAESAEEEEVDDASDDRPPSLLDACDPKIGQVENSRSVKGFARWH